MNAVAAGPVPERRVDLVVYAFDPWSTMWKRTQMLVHHLQDSPWLGRVLYVNPAIHLMDLGRRPALLGDPVQRQALGAGGVRRITSRVAAATPLVPPLGYPGKPLAGLRRRLEERLVAPYVRGDFILWAGALLRPEHTVFWDLFERAPFRIFDWSDDFATFAVGADERREDEEITGRFLAAADLVVTVNAGLAERASRSTERVRCLRNGTDYERMVRATRPETPVHPGLARLSGPVIGYMGYMNQARLDTELLLAVARARPAWQFAFVGPQVTAAPLGDELPRLPNVHVFPPVPYDELPGVLKGFDVCTIPNRINEHTAGNDPIKLFDYLASGRPVVATPTAGLAEFADVVGIAADAPAFEAALAAALAGADDPEARGRRLARGERYSWRARTADLDGWIRELVLGDREVPA
ncbi:glycosyltransferase [bacterium]|nr:glycosyltransferase [bacterium]